MLEIILIVLVGVGVALATRLDVEPRRTPGEPGPAPEATVRSRAEQPPA